MPAGSIEAEDRLGAGEDIQAIADEIIAPDFVAHLTGGLDLGSDAFLHFAERLPKASHTTSASSRSRSLKGTWSSLE